MIPTVMYEGEGLFRGPVRLRRCHRDPGPADPATTAEHEGSTESLVPPGQRRAVAERRGEAMRRFFPKLSAWFTNKLHAAQMREANRYLEAATDIFDLEQRIRHVERMRHSDLN
ncbi:MAG TPA: hypothetical protein VFR86_29440 [Burkholderiaceae bacterium]|nr:hypothetical protein [Burkholderiaceae bacterium]